MWGGYRPFDPGFGLVTREAGGKEAFGEGVGFQKVENKPMHRKISALIPGMPVHEDHFMAKKPTQKPTSSADSDTGVSRLPVNKLHPIGQVIDVDDGDFEWCKLREIIELLWLPETLEEEKRNARIVRAIELYESLEPQDGAESMLAAQMTGTHFAALDCLRRAAVPGQTFEGRDMALKHAQKLMTLYARQLETLNKHRGKGQQKVTVEYVNVAAGGQAIVGTVETSRAREKRTLANLEHQAETPMEEIKFAKKAPRGKTRR